MMMMILSLRCFSLLRVVDTMAVEGTFRQGATSEDYCSATHYEDHLYTLTVTARTHQINTSISFSARRLVNP